jgi:hypothetical protein
MNKVTTRIVICFFVPLLLHLYRVVCDCNYDKMEEGKCDWASAKRLFWENANITAALGI